MPFMARKRFYFSQVHVERNLLTRSSFPSSLQRLTTLFSIEPPYRVFQSDEQVPQKS